MLNNLANLKEKFTNKLTWSVFRHDRMSLSVFSHNATKAFISALILSHLETWKKKVNYQTIKDMVKENYSNPKIITFVLTMCVSVCVCVYICWLTMVKGDPKATFSIATTSKVWRRVLFLSLDCSTLPLIHTL